MMDDFRVQLYGDLAVYKEVNIRKKVLAVYNKLKEDFDTKQDYNQYLVLVYKVFTTYCTFILIASDSIFRKRLGPSSPTW